ncbi:S-adenosylmethionine decarboxylase proenzyme [Candidatus Hepatincola sp. Pdp]
MDNLLLDTEEGDAKEVLQYASKDGVLFAGTHLLIDLWEATNLNSPKDIDKVLRDCAIAAGATILHSHMHHFNPQGVSGVVVLAESHISIHTWPERGYAALDIFVCGDCNPYLAIPILKDYFKPKNIQLSENRRGVKA